MYGSANGGANLPGHVLSAIVNPASSTSPVWQDLTLGPVANDSHALNKFGMDISSIFIDPHDTTGKTVYVTVGGSRKLIGRDPGGLPHHRWRGALDGSDCQSSRDPCQQPGRGPAGRRYGLYCHR